MKTLPNSELAQEKYRRHASGYDQSALRTMPLRKRTIAKLNLRPGDVVLDVACGTGLSFPLIEEKIGPSGQLVGVEVSSEMLALAQDRVKLNQWKNVQLVRASLDEVKFDWKFDAVLFNYTHDVIRSPVALENIFGATLSGTRVAMAGMKLLPWWLFLGNFYVKMSARPYMTTLEGLEKPWSLAEKYLSEMRIENTLWGTGYIGFGAVHGK